MKVIGSSGASHAAPSEVQSTGAPRFPTGAELLDRRQPLWYGSQGISLLLHAVLVAWMIQTGVVTIEYRQRFGYGYQLGQAVLLASPLFELGGRSAIRGRGRDIPLSALVAQEKLYAPDLRRLQARGEAEKARTGATAQEEQHSVLSETSPSSLSIPYSSGGGALPSGSLPERVSSGPATPFDLVPPSNAKGRQPGERRDARVMLGDANVAGGGAKEGLRLPESPKRVGIGVEARVDVTVAPAMEEYLAAMLGRLRRAGFELMPDKRELGAPGLAVVTAVVDRAGRITRKQLAASSANAAVDRLALALTGQIPAYQPLPPDYAEDSVQVIVRVRYYGR